MQSLLAPQGKYPVTEKNVKNFLKSLPDDKVRIFYENIEWTPFPMLLAKEYKKRFSKREKKLRKTRTKKIRMKRRAKTVRLHGRSISKGKLLTRTQNTHKLGL